MYKAVLRNLLTNAVKFSFSDGKIELDIKFNNNSVTTIISDNGTGIKNPETLWKNTDDKLNTGTSGEKGTGLGLMLCKKFVELHNGQIWAENNTENGAKFLFSLPQIPE